MCVSCFDLTELIHDTSFKPNELVSKAVFDVLETLPNAKEMDMNDKAVFLIILGAYNLNWLKVDKDG
jgi:hypothetical protein